jgi:hypothetical protein
MKAKFVCVLLMPLMAGLVTTGCVETVDGHSQAGLPFIKDRVEGQYERSVPQVVDAAARVIKRNGQLTSNNTINNSLEGKVNQITVWVKVDAIDTSKPITQVQVQARTRAGGTDLDLAHEIEKEIALELVR